MIRIGVVGAGYWGPNLIRNFANIPDVTVKYVADMLPGKEAICSRKFSKY